LATGGGFSQFFERPAWQHCTGHEGAGRGVPDVAGKADYANGYLCRLAGRGVLGGGTSVVVPMWAGLVACLNHRLGRRCGWLTPLLYHARMGGVLTDVFEGNNGLYDAVEGWDATTGLGSPRGETLLRALLTGGSPA
jgi:kumamolisin